MNRLRMLTLRVKLLAWKMRPCYYKPKPKYSMGLVYMPTLTIIDPSNHPNVGAVNMAVPWSVWEIHCVV